jgi:Lrp/AsnC family transcriptional regulator, leucine-responsive regulatory protein
VIAVRRVDSTAVDAIDRAIIGALVADGRITLHGLAEVVHLGDSATRERLRRLERTVIRGYAASTDPVVLGFRLEALVEVDLPGGSDTAAFEAALWDMPQVVEALHATGEHDYVLRLRCTDTDELHAAVRRLKTRHSAIRTNTSVVLDHTLPHRQRLPDEPSRRR